jgi:hypothetical protein
MVMLPPQQGGTIAIAHCWHKGAKAILTKWLSMLL